MPIAAAAGSISAIFSFADGWPMSFTSVHYLLFLPLIVGGYFVLPGAVRRVWLLLGSYWFYFFAAPRYLVVLLGGTLAAWLCGLAISATPAGRKKTCVLLACVALLVLGLAFFKYNNFFKPMITPLLNALGLSYPTGYFTTLEALGISFYTFTAIGYLIDTARGDVPAEKNLLNLALFLGFFATVSMGPICRAGNLLPQLKDDTRWFDTTTAADALRLFAIGMFKKLAVADTIRIFASGVYGKLDVYQGFPLLLASLAFALQLYFDFSGYSDMALASAKLLGIQLPQNFQTPYFATNFSSFWSRWHISLSTWLQDYIFTPLVWSRWTEKLPLLGKRAVKPPVLSAIAVTFLVSGIWHGDTLCYVVWGGLQAVYRIGEELLHRKLGKPRKNPSPLVRLGKIAVVLVLWVQSLVFFNTGMQGGTVADALYALGRQFAFGGPGVFSAIYTTVFNGFYSHQAIALAFILFSLACLALALAGDWIQHFRLKDGSLSTWMGGLPAGRRWLLYFVLVLGCLAGLIATSGGFDGSSFLYRGF